MDRVFTERTEEAYIYAIIDVILTLLLREAVAVVDRQTETALRLPHPPHASSVRGTVGARAKDILSASTAAFAADSIALSKPSALRRLTQAGGRAALIENGASKFGAQIAKVFGGHLINRSPTCLFHCAPGLLHDVDLVSCYPTILADMDINWGTPIVFEPGANTMTAKSAVDFLSRTSSPNSWYITVTGDLPRGVCNTLIPSQLGATTSDNLRIVAMSKTRQVD